MRRRRRSERLGALLLALLAAASGHAKDLPPIAPIERGGAAEVTLQLEIVVNGRPSRVIVPTKKLADGRITVARGELAEAGVKAPGSGAPSEIIDLASAGLNYRYDEEAQKLYFDLPDEQRMPKIYDSRGERSPVPPPTASWGALVNYTFYAGATSAFSHWSPTFTQANLAPDARFFSPYADFEQTLIVGRALTYDLFRFRDTSTLRLDSTITHYDHDGRGAYRAGDVIAGGFDWTRPIRLGGLQLQQNFGRRADLVTGALPSISGSAAAPSSVDVFVNGNRAFTQQVGEGPFRLTNLPVSSGDGKAEVVIRDATGRETRSEISLFASELIVPPGQLDYTLEAGFARRFYALKSDDYDRNPIGAGSFRYGFSDRLTLQAHSEGGAKLGNGGVGAVAALNGYGVLATAASASAYQGRRGGQGYASYQFPPWFGLMVRVSSQRSFGDYEDLASATAPNRNGVFAFPFVSPLASGASAPPGVGSAYGPYVLPPRAMDRVSVSAPVWALGGSIGASFAQILQRPQVSGLNNPLDLLNPLAPSKPPNNSRAVNISYSRELPYDGTLFVTAFADLAGSRNKGLFAGVSFPLWGNDIRGTLGAQSAGDPFQRSDRVGFNAQVQKSLGGEPGSYGWGVNAIQGENPQRSANLSYRSPFGLLQANGTQLGHTGAANAQFEGAVAAANGTVVAGPKVDDAFAVVNAGASGVEVLRDNGPVGRTNLFGGLLVPAMRSYERNKISIDATTLPPDAVPETTEQIVAPMRRSGVGVDFGVKTHVKSVLVILTDAAGKPIETGSRGKLVGGGSFLVGYDGRAFVREVSEENEVVVDLGDHDCHASFTYEEAAANRNKLKAVCQ